MQNLPFLPLDSESPPTLQGEALSTYVQNVAEALRDDLNMAGELTAQWQQASLAESLVDAAVRRCLNRLEATGCVGVANRLPSSRLWNLLGERLSHSWLVHRARTKPRGYAGDYELLEWICENRVGDHPFGRALDRFFQNQAAPHAVRARTDLFASAIVEALLHNAGNPVRLVHVGAGPAADVRRAAAMLPAELRLRLHATLLDLDPAALDFACERLTMLLPGDQIAVRQVNVKRLKRESDAFSDADVLACPGLFDYLTDEEAAALLSLFWQRLRPGGRLLVGNFAPDHPTRSYMEWVGNWYLIYRTKEDLRRLAIQAGIPLTAFSITAERFGVNLFILAQKR